MYLFMNITNITQLYKLLQINQKDIDINDPNEIKQLYHYFSIPKKSGGERIISAPFDNLKEKQLLIKKIFLDNVSVSPHAHGFVTKRSIVTNATVHIGKKTVYNLDIENFFPSIKKKKIFYIFNKVLNLNNEVAKVLANICTLNGSLPQGAPTSPVLSNIASIKLDNRLAGYASKNNLKYTRYADDITFSGDKISSFNRKIIKKMILEEGFLINHKKERMHKSDNRQIVTGLIVNDKLKVNENIILELKNVTYYAKKFGIVNHMEKEGIDNYFYKEYIYGKAYFLKMVDKTLGEFYLDKLDEIEWYY